MVPEPRLVHVIPSALVKIVLKGVAKNSPSFPPTATNWLPFPATSLRSSVVPIERLVQVIPSGLVRMAPFSPMLTN
jgi:hypothetical protein